jgi:hypothetical protein
MQIKKYLLGIALLSLLLSPLPTLGHAETSLPKNAEQRPENFCIRLKQDHTQVSNRLATGEKQLREKKTEVQGKLKERRTERQAKIQEKRSITLGKAEESLKKLETNATPEQKAAIAEFRASHKEAQEIRKMAVDNAMLAYKTALDKLFAERHTAAQTVTIAFKNSMNQALQKAKADCATGVEQSTIKATLNASVKAAQEKFKLDRKSIEKPGQDVELLVKTRNEAVRKANEDFKATMKTAHEKLKAAFDTKTTEE